MKRDSFSSKMGLVGFSPLTPALSPLRGEGARRATLIRATPFAAFVAFRSFEPIQSEGTPTR